MKIEKHHEGIRYLLTNENIEIGDEVFSMLDGRYVEGELYLHKVKDSSDFPYYPHVVQKIEEDLIRTDMGYSHKPRYFKIIKREKQFEDKMGFFVTYNWIEI